MVCVVDGVAFIGETLCSYLFKNVELHAVLFRMSLIFLLLAVPFYFLSNCLEFSYNTLVLMMWTW